MFLGLEPGVARGAELGCKRMGTDTWTSAPEARPRKAGIGGLAPLDRPEGAAVERAVQCTAPGCQASGKTNGSCAHQRSEGTHPRPTAFPEAEWRVRRKRTLNVCSDVRSSGKSQPFLYRGRWLRCAASLGRLLISRSDPAPKIRVSGFSLADFDLA
jgi:hypothetical protein